MPQNHQQDENVLLEEIPANILTQLGIGMLFETILLKHILPNKLVLCTRLLII